MLAAEAPKITDWMQAWGSLAGLVMSTAAVIFTGLLFRHEIRVRREEKADAEAAHARLLVTTFMGLGRESRKDSEYTVAGVRVNNFSEAPVLDVKIRHTCHGDEMTFPRDMPVLVGEVETDLRLRQPLPGLAGDIAAKDVKTEILFTDVNGRRWKRVGSNPPIKVLPVVDRTVSRKKLRIRQAVGFALGVLIAVLLNYFGGLVWSHFFAV